MNLTLDRVLDALHNGDTAADVAARLNEPGGEKCEHSARRVLPLLNQARAEGKLIRKVNWQGSTVKPARWSFA